jgi:hypothetical protein
MQAEQRRQKPRLPSVLQFAFDGNAALPPGESPPPDQLHLEPTHDSGEIALWLDDMWWIDAIRRWRDRPMAVHLMPTPFALLHPVLLHQMDMLRRVVPHWRRVGHGYLDDVLTDDDMARIASSPYDEVRIIDGPRPGMHKPAAELRGVAFPSLLLRVTRLQSAIRATKPVLVRIPPHASMAASPCRTGMVDAVHTST